MENFTVNPVSKLIELDKQTPRRILVVGDAMTDIYVHGKIHTSCQDNCIKFVEDSRVLVPGGAANAGRSLKHWFSRVGSVYEHRYGPVKTRFLVDNKIIFRHDNDSINCDLDFIRDTIINSLDAWNPEGILISDYDKGLINDRLIYYIVEFCRRNNAICVSDMKQNPYIYKGTILKCNQDYQQKYNQQLSEMVYGPDNEQDLVVTTGPYTPIVWDNSRLQKGFPFLPPVNCINHIGAGDCFAAHLTLALTHGMNLRDATMIAYSASRIYVQHYHNEPPKPYDIEEDFQFSSLISTSTL